MRGRKNISSHPLLTSLCSLFPFSLFHFCLFRSSPSCCRRDGRFVHGVRFLAPGPGRRKRRGNNSRVHSRKRNSGEKRVGKFVGRETARARARASSVNNRPKKRRGGRIICWTPGRERLIAALCLRDTREFCNCDDRGRAE